MRDAHTSSAKARCARGIWRTPAERGSFRSLLGVLWTFFKLVHALPLPFDRAASNSKQLGATNHFSNRTTFDSFVRLLPGKFDFPSIYNHVVRLPGKQIKTKRSESRKDLAKKIFQILAEVGGVNIHNCMSARVHVCVCACEWVRT